MLQAWEMSILISFREKVNDVGSLWSISSYDREPSNEK